MKTELDDEKIDEYVTEIIEWKKIGIKIGMNLRELFKD